MDIPTVTTGAAFAQVLWPASAAAAAHREGGAERRNHYLRTQRRIQRPTQGSEMRYQGKQVVATRITTADDLLPRNNICEGCMNSTSISTHQKHERASVSSHGLQCAFQQHLLGPKNALRALASKCGDKIPVLCVLPFTWPIDPGGTSASSRMNFASQPLPTVSPLSANLWLHGRQT